MVFTFPLAAVGDSAGDARRPLWRTPGPLRPTVPQKLPHDWQAAARHHHEPRSPDPAAANHVVPGIRRPLLHPPTAAELDFVIIEVLNRVLLGCEKLPREQN